MTIGSNIHDYVRSARSSFYYPMLAVPREKREAILMIYAFCRYTDDLVDLNTGAHRARELLLEWREELHLALRGHSKYEFLNALHRIAGKFSIPSELFFQLIRGVEMDLYKTRYRSFEELYEYCYHVASTVGLMIIRILGRDSEDARAFAIHTGIALQLTNIIRDVASDYRRGRVYLPAEDLESFGLREDQLIGGRDRDKVMAFLTHQCERARTYYDTADRHYDRCRSYALFPARAMQNVYRGILDLLESHTPDLPNGHVNLSLARKFGIVVNTWLHERRHR